jgi:DNA-binding NarL/FixJ family response regulator
MDRMDTALAFAPIPATAATARIRVLVTHDVPLLRAGIAAGLRSHADLDVIEAVQAHAVGADVVVADYDSGLAHAAGAARVLLVTERCSEWEIRHAVAQGVRGYLLQSCLAAQLVDAVRQVAAGSRCFDAHVSGLIAESLVRVTLTQREHEVLARLVQGLCNKTIARELAVSLGTVKAHVRAILSKLDVQSRTQAVLVAGQRGLLRVPAPLPAAALRAAGRAGAPGRLPS